MADLSSAVPMPLAPYRSSGRAPILGLAAGAFVGAVVSTVLAPIYVVGATWVPIVQLSALFTVGFGAAVGAAVAGVMRATKVRNRWVTVGFATLATGWGWAFSWWPWVWWVFVREDPSASLLDLFNPFYLVGALSAAYEYGTWSMGSSGTAVSGIPLAIVWLAEAGTLVGTSVLVAVTMTADRVFCESCGSWCSVEPDLRLLDASVQAELCDGLRTRGDVAALAAAPVAPPGDLWLAVKVAWCPKCGGTNAVALDRATASYDRRGNRSVNKGELFPFHLVSPEAMQHLRGGRG